MPKRNQKKEKKERAIYLLLSPTKKNFLIGHCLKESIHETYRHNLKGRRESTKEFIQEIYPMRPCIFVLETLTCTTSEATKLLIVWVKIFLNKGYKCYNRESIIEMSQDLYYDNEFLFKERNQIDLEELISCNRCTVPTYKNNTCENFPSKFH